MLKKVFRTVLHFPEVYLYLHSVALLFVTTVALWYCSELLATTEHATGVTLTDSGAIRDVSISYRLVNRIPSSSSTPRAEPCPLFYMRVSGSIMLGTNGALTEDMSQLLSSVVIMTFSVKKTVGIVLGTP